MKVSVHGIKCVMSLVTCLAPTGDLLAPASTLTFSSIAQVLPASKSSKRFVPMEGAPGECKSTFAWDFFRRWERGEIAWEPPIKQLKRGFIAPHASGTTRDGNLVISLLYVMDSQHVLQ